MGQSYSVIPLNKFLDWEGSAEYLRERGLTPPYRAEYSRAPTLSDIRTVLSELEDYTTEYGGGSSSWQARISSAVDPRRGPNTTINVLNIVESEAGEQVADHFYFEKGWPQLALHILEKLSRVCGPFVFIPDSEPTPTIVTPGMALPELPVGAPPPFTVASLQNRERRADDTRYEIINGRLYIAGQPHWRHQLCAGRILSALLNWIDQTGTGVVLWAPGLIFTPQDGSILTSQDFVAPDVVWASYEWFRRMVNKDGSRLS